MLRMYASNSHSYTHLILALGIVREPTVWEFITSKYPGIHDIGRANETHTVFLACVCVQRLEAPDHDIVRERTRACYNRALLREMSDLTLSERAVMPTRVRNHVNLSPTTQNGPFLA